MSPALGLAGAAALVVVLLGVLLVIAFRGADIARARQASRYRVLELRSEEKSIRIRTERHLWQAEQDAARREQVDRHYQKRRALNDWHREYMGYKQ